MRRSALLEVGGFDTSIKFYGEEYEFSLRLKRAGKGAYPTTALCPYLGSPLEEDRCGESILELDCGLLLGPFLA